MDFFAQIPLVVSYYTRGTPYEQEALNLKSSCEDFGIEYYIEGIEDRGGWAENCSYKSFFLKELFNRQERSLLWVDADAVFKSPLTFEEFMFSDLGLVVYEEQEDLRFQVAAGTVYINRTLGGQKALELWCHYCQRILEQAQTSLPFVDQMGLGLVLRSHPPLTIAPIPLAYCKIFDHEIKEQNPRPIVIEHRQASRRWK